MSVYITKIQKRLSYNNSPLTEIAKQVLRNLQKHLVVFFQYSLFMEGQGFVQHTRGLLNRTLKYLFISGGEPAQAQKECVQIAFFSLTV